jgi:hypothetical protein
MQKTRKDRRTPVPKAAKELVLVRDRGFEKRLKKLSAKIQQEIEEEERQRPHRLPGNRGIHTVVKAA